MVRMMLIAIVLALGLHAPAAADDKGKQADPKKQQDPKKAKPGDGKKDPTVLARTISDVLKGFGEVMKEPNAVKNLPRLKKIMDSVFEAIVRMAAREQWADLKVLLEAYIAIIKDVGPAQFDRAQEITKRYSNQRKLAAKEGLELYKSFVRYRTWMNKFYNEGCPKELKPTVKQAIEETDKLIKRFMKWLLTLPSINKDKLNGAAEEVMDKFGKAVNQGGGGDALRKAGDALRGVR